MNRHAVVAALIGRLYALLARIDPSQHPVYPGADDIAAQAGAGVPGVAYVHLADQQPEADLDVIPSMTGISERRFLHSFFSASWPGSGSVIEMGPFLGGSTRAIAMGMMINPRRQSDSKLYTFDRFRAYFEGNALADLLKPMLEHGHVSVDVIERAKATGHFAEIFQALHARYAYFELVVPIEQQLPERPQEIGDPGVLVLPDEADLIDAAFVDGCKSWFGTKYFMQQIARGLRPGSSLLLQDFGRHTCFWLPTFTHVMGESLRMICAVEDTYLFQVIRTFDAAEIDQRFPDEPEALGGTFFDDAFRTMISAAETRIDRRGSVKLRLQHAAATAYLGDLPRARHLIEQASQSQFAFLYEPAIAAARHSPTYRPNGSTGEQILL